MKRLNVDGYIVNEQEKWIYDYLEMPYITLGMFRAFLKDADGDEIELVINCFGGSVFIGASMYGELRDYKGLSTSKIIGVSASASSFMMLGTDKITASPMATVLIHNAQKSAEGDYRDMEHAADMLKQINESMINAYEIRTGKSRETIAEYMDKETLMTAQDALKIRLIDEIDLKDGEELTDNKFSMLTASKIAACFSPTKMHALAIKLKPDEPKEEQTKAADDGGFLMQTDTVSEEARETILPVGMLESVMTEAMEKNKDGTITINVPITINENIEKLLAKLDENREEIQPVSDKQKELFNQIKRKLLEV